MVVQIEGESSHTRASEIEPESGIWRSADRLLGTLAGYRAPADIAYFGEDKEGGISFVVRFFLTPLRVALKVIRRHARSELVVAVGAPIKSIRARKIGGQPHVEVTFGSPPK